jgi:hypothetical protein
VKGVPPQYHRTNHLPPRRISPAGMWPSTVSDFFVTFEPDPWPPSRSPSRGEAGICLRRLAQTATSTIEEKNPSSCPTSAAPIRI